MKKLGISVIIFALYGCTKDPLIGTWCESLDQGETCFGYETFTESEKVISKGVFPGTDVAYEMAGSYSRNGKTICLHPSQERHIDRKTDEVIAHEPTQEMCFTVLKLSDDTLRYKLENMPEATMYKIEKSPNRVAKGL